MPDSRLQGCRILVVEDEFFLADELTLELEAAQAIVLGPVGYLDEALELIAAEAQIDGAILDLNLSGDSVIPAADLLLQRGVPLVFTTGYGAFAIPERFAHVTRCEKPTDTYKLAEAIGRVIHA